MSPETAELQDDAAAQEPLAEGEQPTPDSELPELAQGQQPDAEQPAAAPEPDVDALLQRPEVKARVEQLAAELAGSRLQQQTQEEQLFQQAQEYAKRLETDDEFYAEQLKQHGEARVFRWLADFYELKAERELRQQQGPVIERVAAQFNTAAVEHFKQTVRQSELWQYLPADVRKQIDSLQYSDRTSWLDEGLKALTAGIKQISGTGRTAQKARQVQEAFQQQRGGPIVPPRTNRASVPPQQIIREYAYGQGSWTLEDFDWARKQLGQDY